MNHSIKFLSLIFSWIVFSAKAQSISYSVRFNEKFDREGGRFVSYQAFLLIDSFQRSVFYIKNTPEDKSAEAIHAPIDTLWRIYKNIEEGVCLFEDYLFSNFKPALYSDSLHSMKWVIQPIQKRLDSFLCTMATTEFRGRKYVAWYTGQLLPGHGPWKFGGLPGLICEIEEANGDLHMRLVAYNPEPASFPFPVKTPKPLEHFKSAGRKFKEKLQQLSSDCTGCPASTTIDFRFWEKMFD